METTTTRTDRQRAISLAEQGELLIGTNRPANRRLGHEFHTSTLRALVRNGILVEAQRCDVRQRLYYGHADLYYSMGGDR